MRRLMALILGALGMERRHGNGAFTAGRRKSDPVTRERRMVLARVEELERRLASYQHVRFPR
jgi:hypothetical protein